MSDSVRTPVNESSPTQYLYRLRDASGALLYVGVTSDWPSRFKQHQRDKAWWPQVAATDVVPIGGSRQQLEAIEKAVIVAERPRYNVVHNAEVRRTASHIVEHAALSASLDIGPPLTRSERQEIVEKYSDHGPEWHQWSTLGYQDGWSVEHPKFGKGVVIQVDDDLVHGDMRVAFEHREINLSIQWAPLKVVST